MSKHGFRVGDKVRVSKPEETEKYPYWDSLRMDIFDGKVGRVVAIVDNDVTIEGMRDWVFCTSWLVHHESASELDAIEREFTDLFARMRAAIERLK